MGPSDWIQIVSVGAVVVALLLNVRQNREIARQTATASQQASLAAAAVKQTSVQNLTAFSADFRAFVEAGPDLLAWFLTSRRIPVGTHDENLRHMFIFTRMDLHEATFQSYAAGQLEADIWRGWRNTIAADVATAEFRTVWSVVASMFSSSFAELINSIIAEHGPGRVSGLDAGREPTPIAPATDRGPMPPQQRTTAPQPGTAADTSGFPGDFGRAGNPEGAGAAS